MFPPDEFVQQLIKQKKLSMTLEESKDLVQGLLNVLPLPEKDSKRVQAEKEFIAGNDLSALHKNCLSPKLYSNSNSFFFDM